MGDGAARWCPHHLAVGEDGRLAVGLGAWLDQHPVEIRVERVDGLPAVAGGEGGHERREEEGADHGASSAVRTDVAPRRSSSWRRSEREAGSGNESVSQ